MTPTLDTRLRPRSTLAGRFRLRFSARAAGNGRLTLGGSTSRAQGTATGASQSSL